MQHTNPTMLLRIQAGAEIGGKLAKYGLGPYYRVELLGDRLLIRESMAYQDLSEDKQGEISAKFKNEVVASFLEKQYVALPEKRSFSKDGVNKDLPCWIFYPKNIPNRELLALVKPSLELLNPDLCKLINQMPPMDLDLEVSLKDGSIFKLCDILRQFPDRNGFYHMGQKLFRLRDLMSRPPQQEYEKIIDEQLTILKQHKNHLDDLDSGKKNMNMIEQLINFAEDEKNIDRRGTGKGEESKVTLKELASALLSTNQYLQGDISKTQYQQKMPTHGLLSNIMSRISTVGASIINKIASGWNAVTNAVSSTLGRSQRPKVNVSSQASVVSDPSNSEGPKQYRNFGCYETIGGRPRQEDAVAWSPLESSDLNNLSPEQIGERLKATYKKLNEEKKGCPDIGTTASTTIYDGKGNLITATLGDSVAFAVVYDKKGEVVGVERLNKTTHNPDDPREQKRLRDAFLLSYKLSGHCNPKRWAELLSKDPPPPIVIGPGGIARVDGSYLYDLDPTVDISKSKGVAVSRAIGDSLLQRLGVSAEADIDIHNLATLTDGYDSSNIGKVQIITTCDGFTDGAGKGATKEKHEEYLSECLRQAKTKPGNMTESELAKVLSDHAEKNGSKDNISVAIQTITPGDKTPTLVGVYDGHGGPEVSAYVAAKVTDTFKQQCQLTSEAVKSEKEMLRQLGRPH